MEVSRYVSEDERWRAVCTRDCRADGAFYYVVKTTGLYSKPSCVTRLPRRENVAFYPSAMQARSDGYRPCGRCRPDEPSLQEWYARAITHACRSLALHHDAPGLGVLAKEVGLSRYHFHRVFKAYTGVTPQAYFGDVREARLRHELVSSRSVSEAIYRSGFKSSGHFYTVIRDVLGMTPTSFRSGGMGSVIRFAEAECWLGGVVIAATADGVCAVLVGGDIGVLRGQLGGLFSRAKLVAGDRSFGVRVAHALDRANPPERGRRVLPSDILRAAYRQRVRQAMRPIPAAGAGSPMLAAP